MRSSVESEVCECNVASCGDNTAGHVDEKMLLVGKSGSADIRGDGGGWSVRCMAILDLGMFDEMLKAMNAVQL